MTVYDAAYRGFNHPETLPLATLDGDVRTAMRALGVRLLAGD